MADETKAVPVTEIVEVPVSVKVEAPKVEVQKKVRPQPIADIPEPRYKLIAYTTNGTLKSNINSGAFMDMGRRNGDIIRSISSSRWMTLDEICSMVWNYEKRMQHPSYRTRKNILEALDELVERDFVTKR